MPARNVIGVDLGASYTKVAWREGFTEGRITQFEDRRSCPVIIDHERLIPSLAIETGRADQTWVFGVQAAALKPGRSMTVHRNWKADLLPGGGAPPAESALRVAHAFSGWLLRRISEPNVLPFSPHRAAVVMCVPAFKDSAETLTRLAAVMEQAGWENDFILKTTEPKANTLGYCTEGLNIRTTFDTPNWGEMFSENHPFIQYTRNTDNHDPATLAVLDIGSFTSDLSIINWHPGRHEGYLDDGNQVSFRHGIAEQLDAVCLPGILDDAAETIGELDFLQLEALKQCLYCDGTYELGGVNLGTRPHQRAIRAAIEGFCETLWGLISPKLCDRSVRWFLITGGGANIPHLKGLLSEHFNGLRGASRPRELSLRDTSRQDTAIGATSLILFTGQAPPPAPVVEPRDRLQPLPPLRNCPCQGNNPNCMRCGGSGILRGEPPVPRIRPQPPPLPVPPWAPHPAPAPPISEIQTHPYDLEPEEFTAPDEEAETGPEVFNTQFSAAQIAEQTLEGWMGALVFGTQPDLPIHNYDTFRHRLLTDDDLPRSAIWYRLLCLACALGAKVPRRTIRYFWETTLAKSGFWEITTSPATNGATLDDFFETLIHREFRSIYAEGEQAELLRRVFYDFRKLHYLTYENGFADVICTILDGVDKGADPVRFLRSGWLPDDRPWRGVIGQSMTSPLLFLMREWRRSGVLKSDRVDKHCYYMNTAARRGACRLGWLPWERLYAYSLEDVLEASSRVHQRLMDSQAWDPIDFDIPLQIIGSQRRRRRT